MYVYGECSSQWILCGELHVSLTHSSHTDTKNFKLKDNKVAELYL